MKIQYDVDKIFEELEKKAKEKISNQKKLKKKTNNSIESPEDTPETKIVAPATSKTTEYTHGGDEASKEIKNSPNSADDGELFSNEDKNKSINTSDELDMPNYNDYTNSIDEFFDKKYNQQQEFKKLHKKEYLKKYMLEVIKKIAANHAGMGKQDGSESYNKKQILQHIVKKQNYKLLNDKYDLRDARYVQFFIDTSGVYGCGSNKTLTDIIPDVINLLERQGYECYIAACGNGFYQEDMVEDEYYHTRETLESYGCGKVSPIACPTPQTAAKMANNAEFSIILADFDGLSTICEMANLCSKDKVPYFLCSEDRYPCEDPTLHDWVEPDLCYYDPDLVYDVSIFGNPTIEEYYDMRDAEEEALEKLRNNEYEYDD